MKKIMLEAHIRQKLEDALQPETLAIRNQSHLHAGHKGSPQTGESHFKIEVTSERFHGLSRIQRHQLIYQILEDDLKNKIHALVIIAKAPGESSP